MGPWERHRSSLRSAKATAAEKADGGVGGSGGLDMVKLGVGEMLVSKAGSCDSRGPGLDMAELGVGDAGEESSSFLVELTLALRRTSTKPYGGGQAGARGVVPCPRRNEGRGRRSRPRVRCDGLASCGSGGKCLGRLCEHNASTLSVV